MIVSILKESGTNVSTEEAQQILSFMIELAKIALAQNEDCC